MWRGLACRTPLAHHAVSLHGNAIDACSLMRTVAAGLRVLVVEDDPLLRALAAETLREEGFATSEAGSTQEALAALAGDPSIPVMLTDIRMPGVDGLALARIARERYPALAIVVTSGRRAVATGDLPIGGSFLAKPYTSASLIAAVEAAAVRG